MSPKEVERFDGHLSWFHPLIEGLLGTALGGYLASLTLVLSSASVVVYQRRSRRGMRGGCEWV